MRVIVSGGPGVGKTTLLQALAARGHAVVSDSARELIRERKARGLSPRPAPAAFARALLARDLDKLATTAASSGWTFFDRSPFEALAMLDEASAPAPAEFASMQARLALRQYFHPTVFVLPPWREIYVQDAERDHDFEHCQRVHHALVALYGGLGFVVDVLPCTPVPTRVAHVLQVLQWPGRGPTEPSCRS